jgi:glycosyltransferase involved in cell wall biosynthesis
MGNLTFDILMATHVSDDTQFFVEALNSLKSEINDYDALILVGDGPIGSDKEELIRTLADDLKIKFINLPISKGLGEALNEGARHSSADYLVRMDADDITLPQRLRKLKEFLRIHKTISVAGSYIEEFIIDPNQILRTRKTPINHKEISARMRSRCAMNHVSCAVSRTALNSVGGYQGGRGFPEDWWLWARLLAADHQFANIPETLVKVRLGTNFLGRRQGLKLFMNDIKFAKKCREIGFYRKRDLPQYFFVKLFQRFSPTWLLEMAYIFLRKNDGKTHHLNLMQ